MKKLVILFLMMLFMASCSKAHLDKGLYYADTKDGLLYLQLDSHKECSMHFEGHMIESDGTYEIKGDEITLNCHAEKKVSSRTVSWWFGGTLGNGTISGSSFKIKSQRLSSSGTEYINLTFHKK